MIACGDLINHDDDRRVRQVSVVALYLDDGHPTALLTACEDTTLYQLSVSDGVNSYWSMVDDDPPNPVTSIRLFVVPAGWRRERPASAQGVPALSELAAITPARTYYVFPGVHSGVDSKTNDDAMTFTFTLDNLASLRPSEVWAPRTPDAQPEAMTPEQFRTASAATCNS